MKLKLQIILASTLAALATHLYLAVHYYDLKFGHIGGQSLCNLNEILNCDTVSASAYAALMNIPMAAFGLAANLIFLGIILTVYLRLTEFPGKLLRFGHWLAILIAGASVVMGAISLTQLSTYCIFCIATYAFSFLNVGLTSTLQDPSVKSKELLKELFNKSLTPTLSIASIPIVAFFIHTSLLTQYDGEKQVEQVKYAIQDWKNGQPHEFSAEPSLVKGASREQAKMIVVEFADFRCGHCKSAAPKISTFAKANPDVRVEFYNFPLDGSCNEAIPRSTGISCRIAKAVHCAGKGDRGWFFHDAVFEQQGSLSGSVDQIDETLMGIANSLTMTWEELKTCMDASQTHETIVQQTVSGQKADVKGTPSFFVNGRKLINGQSLLNLNAAKEALEN